MNSQNLVLFSFLIVDVFAVNDYIYYNLTCDASASKTVELNVCECTKKKIFIDFTVTRPLNWSVCSFLTPSQYY